VQAEWAAALPGLDTSPIGVVARIGRAGRYLDAGMERLFAEHGLTREGWDVLAALRRTGPPYRRSPTQLHRALMRTSGAMTNRLHRLEGAGLVRRVPDDADGRGVLVELTPEGRRLIERVAPEHLANERAMLAGLTRPEQDALAGLLRKLLVSLESAGAQPAAARRPPRPRSGGGAGGA
jgi:DNA-binding MarR family transcriptional regulator